MSGPRQPALALLIACTATLAVAASARADAVDYPARARLFSDQGRAYHERGEYDQAIAAYKQAYQLAPSPGLLFNMGQAYRLGGDCTDAAIMYRSFLGTRPGPAERRLAEIQLANVEECMARRSMLEPLLSDTAVTPSGADRATMPRVDARTNPGGGLRLAGIAVAAGGGSLLGLGIYYAVKSDRASDQVERAYDHGATWKDVADIDARGRRASALATAFTLGGGAAVVAGGVMYVMGWRAAKRAEHPRITVAPHRGGGEVRLAWAF